jgi:hypothetical protein
MSEIASPSRAKRAHRSANAAQPTRRKTANGAPAARDVSTERRQAMIAEGAYFRAAERGFQGGDPVADWLASERDVDALLSAGEPRPKSMKGAKKHA